MAAIVVDQGLDAMLDIFPKVASLAPASTFLGFFTSQTGTTVPGRTATSGASATGWTEATGTNYARQAVAGASWQANTTNGNGRRTTAAQITFPTVGSGGWGTLNGISWTELGAFGAGDIAYGFSNFDDLTPIVTTENDIVRVTPYFQGNGQ